jgi:phosphodiesterase/alkaline phosphatase D-like protein
MVVKRRVQLLLAAVLSVGLVASASTTATPAPEPTRFPNGVASGEITARSALLWTRAFGDSVRLQLARNTSFTPVVRHLLVSVPRAHDHTLAVRVSRLHPGTRYYYRFQNPTTGELSRVGTFMTAPAAAQNVDVHFAFSGDSDGWTNPATGKPAYNSFPVLDQVRKSHPDFFTYLGDTIYADSDFSPFGPAATVSEYRRDYKQNRKYAALRSMEAALPIYAEWDDHEVRNDFDRTLYGDKLFHRGLRVFREYQPVPTWNPTTGFYRTFRWGKNVEVFILDERSFRSPEVAHFPKTHPTDTSPCDNPPGSGAPDLAPTLPQPVRDQFAQLVPQLANPVPQACLDAIYDPSRTMLGAAQLARFEHDLSVSDAKFKVVFNEVPIQEFFVAPYDRWEGYGFERLQLINFIQTHGISGVTWLTTDTHANIENDVFYPSVFGGADTGMKEVIVGPIATDTFSAEITKATGSPLAALAFITLLGALHASCSNINADAYGDVTYHASSKTMTVDVRNDHGGAICSRVTLP